MMILSISILLLFSFVSSYFLYLSVKKNLQLIEELESVTEKIEASIENLNFYQKRFEKKLKLEIFYDDPIVKEMTEDMKQAKSVLSSIIISLSQKEDDSTDKT